MTVLIVSEPFWWVSAGRMDFFGFPSDIVEKWDYLTVRHMRGNNSSSNGEKRNRKLKNDGKEEETNTPTFIVMIRFLFFFSLFHLNFYLWAVCWGKNFDGYQERNSKQQTDWVNWKEESFAWCIEIDDY